jgi:hypothetical protein
MTTASVRDGDSERTSDGRTDQARHIPPDPLLRDAYRDAFGKEPGDVTVGLGIESVRVSVTAPNEQLITGSGLSRRAALENLIDLLTSLKPDASG